MLDKKKWLGLGALLIGGVLAAGGAALWWFPGYLLQRIVSEARQAGIELRECRISVSLSEIALDECQFKVIEMPIGGALGAARIAISGWAPQSVSLQGSHVRVGHLMQAPIADRLRSWLSVDQAQATPIGVQVSDASITFAPESGLSAFTISKLKFNSQTTQGEAAIGGPLGVSGAIAIKQHETVIALHSLLTSSSAKLQVETADPSTAKLRLSFKGLPLGWLSALMPAPAAHIVGRSIASGSVYAEVPLGLSTKGVRGDFRTTLKGLALPLPKALGGLVSRKSLAISSDFSLAPNNQDLRWTKLETRTGTLVLKGDGRITLGPLQAPFKTKLRGSLSCGALVEAAAHAHSDSPLAHTAARIVRSALKGRVRLSVSADGDGYALQRTRLKRSISAGCGIKEEIVEGLDALIGEALEKMPIPPQLEALKDAFEKGELLPDLNQLPKLPKLRLPSPRLPRLPELPKLPLGSTEALKSQGSPADGATEPDGHQ